MAGIDFELSEEQLQLRDVAREFAQQEITPAAALLDREADPRKAFPRELIKRASALGLRTLTLPREYGGHDADSLTQAIVLEELCAGDCSVGMALNHAWREGLALAVHTTAEQRDRFLPAFVEDDEYLTSLGFSEPHAGSDHFVRYAATLDAGTSTTAVRDGEEWVINGRKKWLTNGNVSRLLILQARTDSSVPWTEGVSLFLVSMDTPGVRVGHVEDKLGLRLNQNAEILFEDCRIPHENLFGEVNQGLAMVRRFAKGSLFKEGVKSLGIARAAFDEGLAWTQTRVQGGSRIVEHQAVRADLFRMSTDIEAARALVWRAAWAVDHDPSNAPHLEAMAKVFAGEVATRTAVSALELHGGYGVLRENRIEKLVRDAVSMLHAFGGNHAVRDRVARDRWGS